MFLKSLPAINKNVKKDTKDIGGHILILCVEQTIELDVSPTLAEDQRNCPIDTNRNDHVSLLFVRTHMLNN